MKLPADIDWSAPACDLLEDLTMHWLETRGIDDETDEQLADAERWAFAMIAKHAV